MIYVPVCIRLKSGFLTLLAHHELSSSLRAMYIEVILRRYIPDSSQISLFVVMQHSQCCKIAQLVLHKYAA